METWEPGHALSVEIHEFANDDGPTTISVRHPTHPYVVAADPGNETALHAALLAYLRDVIERLPGEVAEAHVTRLQQWHHELAGEGPSRMRLSWLSTDGSSGHPIRSFRFRRDAGEGSLDENRVLLAIPLVAGHAAMFCGAGIGLHIVARVIDYDGCPQVDFTSLSAALPYGAYAVRPTEQALHRCFPQPSVRREQTQFLQALLKALHQAMPLVDVEQFVIQGFRVGRHPLYPDDALVELSLRGCKAARSTGTVSLPIEVSAEFIVSRREAPHSVLLSTRERLLTAHAVPPRSDFVFDRDPRSVDKRGPSTMQSTRADNNAEPMRDGDVLDTFRVEKERTAAHDWLRSDPSGLFRVLQTAYVASDSDPRLTKSATPKSVENDPQLRSDELTAVSAHHHASEFFKRIVRYGIDAAACFRHASLPLKIYYRSGTSTGPGHDGNTVNAEVKPECPRFPVSLQQQLATPHGVYRQPALQLHFARASLAHRRKHRHVIDGVEQWVAEPVGLALDPRWFWHELGHVLLFASTDELELPFAHSIGDALAAVVADPHSSASGSADEEEANRGWRGLTLPWVAQTRRHDRDVREGWGWNGTLQQDIKRAPYDDQLKRKGYVSEQILSSSLFRLYLALGGATDKQEPAIPGGETVADRKARETASHYVVYLIMRGTNLLGSSRVVPAVQPDQFVTELINADISTSTFSIPLFGDLHATNNRLAGVVSAPRTGGCAHKVIRWAFEAQGLYATDPTLVTDAPGRPPSVDIYLRDRRLPDAPAANGGVLSGLNGGYTPVSLDEHLPQPFPGAQPPRWFAAKDAVDWDEATNELTLRLGNRGHIDATAVEVSVWWHIRQPRDTSLPDWSSSVWAQEPLDNGLTVPAGSEPTLGPYTLSLRTGEYYLLVIATCADDRANTDPASRLPCSDPRASVRLVDLVAGDNNLALTVINVSKANKGGRGAKAGKSSKAEEKAANTNKRKANKANKGKGKAKGTSKKSRTVGKGGKRTDTK